MSDYSKILVAYFSYSGVTKGIAEKVVDVTGADMFHIETVEPYSQVYKEVVKRSQMELISGKRPEINGHVDNMNEYDTILVCFPNWLSTCPTAVMTFLEQYDMRHKTILPFITHGGGGIGHAREDIEKICPNARVVNTFDANDTSEEKIANWLHNAGIQWKEKAGMK